jgi:hypothetical protein
VIRRGGVATNAGGERVVWTVADGRRGRRWRESVSRDGTLLRAVLLELDPDGRVTRLEVATAHGLLTLHPDEGGGTMHGNVVAPDGVRHLSFDWSSDRELLVTGSPASAAIVEARFATTVLRIADDLDPVLEPRSPSRRSAAMTEPSTAYAGADWPLELD